MTNMPNFLKTRESRVDYLRAALGDFAHANRDLLIIVGDPKTDEMFVAYKDRMVLGRLKSLEGSGLGIVNGVVRQSAIKSKFDTAVDRFTGGLVDLLKLPLTNKAANEFYSFISSVLYNFQDKAKAWTEKREKVEAVLAEGVK